jgi:hypothetical protein
LGVVAIVATLTGCGSWARKDVQDAPQGDAGTADAPEATAPKISEDVWVALAGLPRTHLMRARELFMVHQRDDAAKDFEAAGALVRLESAHARNRELSLRLDGAGIELRELGRSIQRQGTAPVQQIDDVMTRAYLALAEDHRAWAAEAVENGRPVPASKYLETSAEELEDAYKRSNLELTKQTESTLVGARAAAERLATDASGDAVKGARAALGALEKDSTVLEGALGARGR